MKKSFVRSIEAVLAILLFFSFYTITSDDYERQLHLIDPTVELSGLFDTMQVNDLINPFIDSYNVKDLSEIINYFIPPIQGFKIELSYLEPIFVTNLQNEEITNNISFLRFFPQTININSLNIIDLSNNILPLSIVNNYYMTVISINVNDELINQTVLLNDIPVKVNSNEIINDSGFVLFLGNEKTIIDVNSIDYNLDYYDANLSLKILVPYAKANSVINAVLFYPANNTNFLQNYANLADEISLDFISLEPKKSKASEIIFTANLNANEIKRFVLYYEINSNTDMNYIELLANNSNTNIIYDDNYYLVDENVNTYESLNSYSIKKSILSSNKNCLINLKVWNYE